MLIDSYKHISFDLDGTLVHTTPEYRYQFIGEVIDNLGGKIKDHRLIDKFWFEQDRTRIIKEDFELDADKFWETYVQIQSMEERGKHTWPYDDVDRTLKKIKNRNKLISIITGSPRAVAEMEIKKLEGEPCDYYLPIHDEKFLSKPDPDSFNFVLNKLGILPSETLAIGNGDEDALFAKNAGVDFIYIERREHDFHFHDYALARVESLDDIFNLN